MLVHLISEGGSFSIQCSFVGLSAQFLTNVVVEDATSIFPHRERLSIVISDACVW